MYLSKLSISNVFNQIIKLLSRPQNGSNGTGPTALPPQYFKSCKLVSLKNNVIQLEMNQWPVIIMADGCAPNVATGNQLSNYLGILSPNLRCVVHLADEAITRIAKSKTRKQIFYHISEQL